MMTRLHMQATAAALALAFILSGGSSAISQSAPTQAATTQTAPTQTAATQAAVAPSIVAPEKPKASGAPSQARSGGGAGHVYLLRGLLNIFSLGMDDLAAKLQARGVSASVHNHTEWQGIADDIAAKYKAGKHGPVILIGHSLGADAVMIMAEYLGKKGVPVALLVPFDGTGSYAASSNVARVMNLTQRDYAYMRKGTGFKGSLQNVDVSKDSTIDHITIDKSARLHNMVVASVLSVLGRGGAPSAPKTAGGAIQSAPAPAATGSTAAAAPAASAAAPKAQ